MSERISTKIVKKIHVDLDKCVACRIKGKEYSQCSFCPVSCPARDLFREPDSGLPLKCDMCESAPPLTTPLCVQVCRPGALTYEERVEAREQKPTLGEMEIGLEALIRKHGFEMVAESIERLSKKGLS